MAKKVLGDDPFRAAPGKKPKNTGTTAPRATRSRASVRPRAQEPETAVVATETVAPESVAIPETAAPESAVATTETVAPESVATVDTGADDARDGADENTSVTSRFEALIEEASPEMLAQMAERLRAHTEVIRNEVGTDARDESDRRLAYDEFDVSKEMMSSEFYLRRWGKIALRDRSHEVDDFGLDLAYETRWNKLVDGLYDRWWKVEVEGVDNVPNEGRVALVANHSGAVPIDGIVLAAALRKEHPAQRRLRWLVEDLVFHTPFVGVRLSRLGAVRACQENAERLLAREAAVGLFPEGLKGISKPFRERYKLQRFGRGGHIKLAIRTRTPIVPVSVVGAEETHPQMVSTRPLARLLGVPFVPVTPTFPWLGPAGLAGLPSRWKIVFGEPISVEEYSPEQADDELLVNRLNEKLRGAMQECVDRTLRERRSVFSGWRHGRG